MAFTNVPWTSPETELDANDYCSVCLLDLNEGGGAKVKGKCYLPIKSTPGGEVNMNAMASAAAYLGKIKVPPEARRKAAKKLRSLYRQADREPPAMVKRYAGE